MSPEAQALRDRCEALADDVAVLEAHGGSFEGCLVLVREVDRLTRERFKLELSSQEECW